MRATFLQIALGIALAAGFVAYYRSHGRIARETPAGKAVLSILPAAEEAAQVLDTTERHREWVNVPINPSGLRVFVVYPGRADRAPAVVVMARHQSASKWIRAVAIRAADEGYIAVVPDLLSGKAPNGGDSDSFPNPAAIAGALEQMSQAEVAGRTKAARNYALALPAATGQSATLVLDTDLRRIEAFVEEPLKGEHAETFALSSQGWRRAASFLADQTNNHPTPGSSPKLPEDHSMHIGMAMAQTAPPVAPGGGRGGYPQNKLPNLPAGVFTARTTLLHSRLLREFVDIAMGNVKLHTWVEYPEGDGKAPIVMVMQHGPGMDDWQRALADQLALEGFIAIAVDLHSGLGPNGGNYDSFEGTDDVMRATARLTQDEMQRRYKAGLEWGKKLPRWNGKVASIGFCMGGGNSFRFAAEVAELNGAVVFYGGTPAEDLLARIKAPVLAFYGEDDARVTAAAEPTKSAMQKLDKAFEYHVYPHATHGFLEFQDLAGNPVATRDSWSRTIAFLKEHTTA
jgi:carboxymethylenebutenolidase